MLRYLKGKRRASVKSHQRGVRETERDRYRETDRHTDIQRDTNRDRQRQRVEVEELIRYVSLMMRD